MSPAGCGCGKTRAEKQAEMQARIERRQEIQQAKAASQPKVRGPAAPGYTYTGND